MIGVALTDLRPSGTAQVGDERIDVVTEGPWIEADTQVKILRSESYRHVVQDVVSIAARCRQVIAIAHFHGHEVLATDDFGR